MNKKILWKIGIWMVFMLYLLVDLVLWKGPIHKQLRGQELNESKYENIAARVFAKPVLLSQVDYAVDQKLWAKGLERADLSDDQRLFYRQVALRDLIDQYIFREKVAYNADDYPVSDAEIDAAVLRFSKRFDGKQDMVAALKGFGFKGEKELRYRLAAKLQQEKYLADKIKIGIAVRDDEARDFYEKYGDQGGIPESVEARHIFISKLPAPNQSSEDKAAYAGSILGKVMDALSEDGADVKQRFSELAAKYSEDERTKNAGGDLGWLGKERLAEVDGSFVDGVFAAQVNQPVIVDSKLGWSVVLVTAKRGARTRSFDEMKAEIVIALESMRRREKIEEYRISLRKQHADKIRVSWGVLEM